MSPIKSFTIPIQLKYEITLYGQYRKSKNRDKKVYFQRIEELDCFNYKILFKGNFFQISFEEKTTRRSKNKSLSMAFDRFT